MELVHKPQHQRGGFRQLQLCKSVWADPVCAATITEKRRIQLGAMTSSARSKGLRVVMVTLTFQHSRADNLRTILEAFLEALRTLGETYGWQKLKKASGYVGWEKALEVTYGEHGWHPHCHLLMFLAGDCNLDEFGELLRALWTQALGRHGLSCNEHGFRLDDTDANIAAYVTKFGHERHWDEAAELTKGHIKHGRGGSRTPFDLLRDAADHPDEAERARAGALYREFVEVFQGRHQLRATPGLVKFLLGDEEKTDGELVTESDAEAIVVALLSIPGWRQVVRQDGRAELMRALDSGRIEDALAVLDGLDVGPDDVLLPVSQGSEDDAM